MSARRGDERIVRDESEASRGIRLIPESVSRLADGTIDPAKPLVCSKIIPIAAPPPYMEGRVSILPSNVYPVAFTGGRPCLVLEQSPGHWQESGGGYVWIPNSPTSWAWNLRAGERVVIDSGPPYTICGPLAILPGDGNPEAFINYGQPGAPTGLTRVITSPDGQEVTVEVEALLLVNGLDDNGDGFVDNGWDGLDNDGDGAVDELDEWTEPERWHGRQLRPVTDAPYRVARRPAPTQEPRGLELPSNAVIDLTGWAGSAERSRLVVDRWGGYVDLLIDRTGKFSYDVPCGVQSSVGMDRSSFAHFWIGEREDIVDPAEPMPRPKGNARLLTINRAGIVSVLTVNPDAPSPDAGKLPEVHSRARRGER